MNNIQAAKDHLRTHQSYPATSEQLLAECNGLSDFSPEDKQWFTSHLPMGKTFRSAQEVMDTLNI